MLTLLLGSLLFHHINASSTPMSTSKEKNGIILNRISLNQSELANLQKLLVANPTAKVVFVTDLHEVVFDRLPGDYARFNQLSLKDKAFFAWNGLRFGTQYIPHKLFGWPKHPAAEAYLLPDPKNVAALELISPFKPNLAMMNFYQHATYPVFVCSNIGEHSYGYMKKQYEKKRKNCPEHAPFNQIIQGAQIATKANGHMQKDKVETFQHLVTIIENKLGYKPDIVIMIDDQEKNIKKFKEAMTNKEITVIGYIFQNAHEFLNNIKNVFTQPTSESSFELSTSTNLTPSSENLTSCSS